MVSHKNVYNSLSLDMKKRFEARKCVFILAESVEPERLIGSGKWAIPVPYVNLTVVSETPISESTTYGEAHLTSYVRGRMGQELRVAQ